MKKWLKHHFIPHEGNNHRPAFLHRKNAVQLIGILLFFELVLFVLPGLNFVGFMRNLNFGAVLPGVLTTLTNTERLSNNLPELRESPVLAEAARLKAEDMASKSYFAHTSPEGKTPWYWLGRVGYSYIYAGENLAVNFIDSADVTRAWMNSPTHRANIVHGAYTEVGTGIATGVYKGNETVFVAQVYGRPSVLNPALMPAAVQKSTGLNRATLDAIKDFFKEAAASPRHATDAVFYTVMGIITLALLFSIFVKMKHQHPDLILNGAMVMVVILGLHVANGYIAQTKGLETSFMAYDSQNHILQE